MVDRSKLINAALAVPVFGAVLLVPPIVNIFHVPVLLFGAPLEVAYLFAVWLGLIVVTALLSRRMGNSTADMREPDPIAPPKADEG